MLVYSYTWLFLQEVDVHDCMNDIFFVNQPYFISSYLTKSHQLYNGSIIHTTVQFVDLNASYRSFIYMETFMIFNLLWLLTPKKSVATAATKRLLPPTGGTPSYRLTIDTDQSGVTGPARSGYCHRPRCQGPPQTNYCHRIHTCLSPWFFLFLTTMGIQRCRQKGCSLVPRFSQPPVRTEASKTGYNWSTKPAYCKTGNGLWNGPLRGLTGSESML